jgi:hypothetical protein
MGHPLPRIESQFDYGLDFFLLKVNALVDLNPAIVRLLFYPSKKMVSISLDVFAFCRIEQFPDIQ